MKKSTINTALIQENTMVICFGPPRRSEPAPISIFPIGEIIILRLTTLVTLPLGLRRADDPLVRDSVALADTLLRSDTPCGPVWHR